MVFVRFYLARGLTFSRNFFDTFNFDTIDDARTYCITFSKRKERFQGERREFREKISHKRIMSRLIHFFSKLALCDSYSWEFFFLEICSACLPRRRKRSSKTSTELYNFIQSRHRSMKSSSLTSRWREGKRQRRMSKYKTTPWLKSE